MGLIRFGHHDGEDSYGGATWSVSSKSDPRFNASGGCYGLFADEPDKHIRATARRLRVTPPKDLEMGVWRK